MLLLTGLILAATTTSAWAQDHIDGLIDEDSTMESSPNDTIPPQRVGLEPTDIQLTANGSGEVDGYCFDQYLIAPRHVTVFEHMLAGDDGAFVTTASKGRVPLSKAIDQGDIDVRAVQLNLYFVNRMGEPATVSLTRPTVLWSRTGGRINPAALAALDRNPESGDRQERIWAVTTAERDLRVLGYLHGSEWYYDRERLADATKRFQQENGLTATGQLDDETMAATQTQTMKLMARLARLGYRDRERGSLRTDPAALIHDFERAHGLDVGGSWSPALESRLASDESVTNRLVALNPGSRSIDDALADGDHAVLTYLHGLGGFVALVDAPGGSVDLWQRTGRTFRPAGKTGASAVEAIDAMSAELAARASNESRLVIYPRVSAGATTSVVFGDHAIDVPSNELAGWVAGGKIPDAIMKELGPKVPSDDQLTGRSASPTIVVYRGPLVQGRGPAALASLGLQQVDGARLATAMDRTFGTRVELYLSDDLRQGASRYHGDAVGAAFGDDAALLATR